jgi:hypothetical protein
VGKNPPFCEGGFFDWLRGQDLNLRFCEPEAFLMNQYAMMAMFDGRIDDGLHLHSLSADDAAEHLRAFHRMLSV